MAEWEFFSSSCLVFQYGVRDFRRGTGAWNMVVGFTTKVQLVGFVTLTMERSANPERIQLFRPWHIPSNKFISSGDNTWAGGMA